MTQLYNDVHALFLDLGNVLLSVNWENSLRHLPPHIHKEDFYNTVALSKEVTDFESGLMSEDAFFSFLENKYSLEWSRAELISIWNQCIEKEVEGVLEVLHRVKVPLYLLSNTNLTHYCVYKDSPLLQNFTKCLYSFELGFRKPSLDIYQKALHVTGFDAKNVLFIDDLEDNLVGARSVGIRSEKVFRDAGRLLSILNQYHLLHP